MEYSRVDDSAPENMIVGLPSSWVDTDVCRPHQHQSPSARWYVGALDVSFSLLVVKATHWQLGGMLRYNVRCFWWEWSNMKKNIKIAPWVTPLRYCNFDQIFYILRGSWNNAPLLIQAKFSMRQYTHCLRSHAKFHLNVLIVSACSGQKPQFWENFDIWRTPVPTPFNDEGQIWCTRAEPRSTLTTQISSRSVYSVALWWRKTPKIYHLIDFGILWCRQLAAIWESWTRVHNHKSSPIQWHQNCFCTVTPSWWNCAHKIWCSNAWRTNRQTDRQKTQCFCHPGGQWNPSSTKLGTLLHLENFWGCDA